MYSPNPRSFTHLKHILEECNKKNQSFLSYLYRKLLLIRKRFLAMEFCLNADWDKIANFEGGKKFMVELLHIMLARLKEICAG